MGKGILLEREGRLGVVLTPQGEFRRVPLPQGALEIGAELEFAEPRPMPWMNWQVAAAAAMLLLVLSPFGYRTWAASQPVALVTVDINPSLELTLNASDQVLDADGLNADGDAVLEGLNWKRRPLSEVMAAVTDKAVELHKLDVASESGAVVVAVAPAGKKELKADTSDRLVSTAREAVSQEVAHKAAERNVTPKTQVVALVTDLADKAEAKASGLTPGQFKILQEIQSAQPDVQPEQIKAKGPGKLIKELGMNPQEIFSKAEEHSSDKAKSAAPATTNPGKKNQAPGNSKDKPGQSKENNGKGSSDKANDKARDNGKSDDKKDQDKGKSDDKGKGAVNDLPGGLSMAPAPAADNPAPSAEGNAAANAETNQPGNSPATGVDSHPAPPTAGQGAGTPGGNGAANQGDKPGQDGKAAPDQDGKAAPGQNDKAAPDQGGKAAPDQGGKAAPDQGGKAAPDQDGKAAPDQGGKAAPDQGGKAAPDQGGKAAPDQGGKAPDKNGKASDQGGKSGQGGKP